MKHTVATLMLTALFSIPFNYAQIDFPDETQNQKWEYVTWNFWGGQCQKRSITNGDKKAICGEDYIQIFDCDEYGQFCHLLGYYRIKGDSILIREVGYWNGTEYVDSVDCTAPYGLVYDFGSAQNDTLQCALNTTYDPFQKTFWVDEITDQVYVGTTRETRSMYYQAFPNSPQVIYQMDWIDGIGSNVHPFYSLSCIGDHCEQEQQMTQVFRNDKLIYQDTALDFSFPCTGWITATVGVPADDLAWQLRPNPASMSFFVLPKTSKEVLNLNLTVYDQLGRPVLTKSKHLSNEAVDVDGLQAGIYVVHVNYQNQHSSLRLVIE